MVIHQADQGGSTQADHAQMACMKNRWRYHGATAADSLAMVAL